MARKAPTNTTKAMDGSTGEAALFILDQMSTGRAIENQEERGQRELANSDTLPSEGSNNPAWAKMGVKFGEEVEGDPLFRYVELPPGWTKRGSDHAMHSDLLDDKGRKRAGIFYKAAFYDRKAHIHLSRRFEATYEPEGGWDNRDYEKPGRFFAVVKDGDKEIYRSAEVFEDKPHPENPKWKDSGSEFARKAADVWLKERYPEAEDPSAYWD